MMANNTDDDMELFWYGMAAIAFCVFIFFLGAV